MNAYCTRRSVLSMIATFHTMVAFLLILQTTCALRAAARSYNHIRYGSPNIHRYSRGTASSLSMVSSSFATPARSDTEPRDYRQMRPIPCTGSYQGEDGRSYSSLFLAFENMVVKEREDGTCICKNIIAVPINDGFEPAITAAMKIGNVDQTGISTRGWSGQTITDRDNGLWDNLANVFTWASKREAQRKIYSALRMRATCYSPYHGIAEALEEHADMQITGLLVEVADRPSQYSLALGAAILLTKKEAVKATGKKWKMNAVRSKQILKDIRFSDEAKLVKCGMDEMIGLAFATSLPIVIPESVFESLNVDGMLQKIMIPGSNDDGKLVMKSPHFSSYEDEQAWRQMKMQVRADVEAKRKRAAKLIPKAMEIKDATSFLKMRVAEKRACLRATGVFELPRPREGPLAVDAMMIPLLDEEVAYEVLRRLAETRGNFAEAAEMEDYESKKPKLARMIMEASKKGDRELALKLCDEMNSLATLAFDPTNPEGVINSQEFDVEAWYYEARKRVYGIIM